MSDFSLNRLHETSSERVPTQPVPQAVEYKLGALRLLHDDGKTWSQWFPVRSTGREATERAIKKLCNDPLLLGFERKDVSADEYEELKKSAKYVVTLE